MRSTTFLQAIDDYAYADLITTLLTCINNYYSLDDDSYLPSTLCIMGLAHQLNKAAKLRAKSVLPRVHRRSWIPTSPLRPRRPQWWVPPPAFRPSTWSFRSPGS